MTFNRSLIIHSRLKKEAYSRSIESALEEATGLAEAINLDVIDTVSFQLSKIKPATYIGGGQIEYIQQKITDDSKIDILIFDGSLTPSQQRNLEKTLDIKVIDRTGLILEIFGKRAKTKEGRAQVQLAALTYQRSRLVRSWTHLERQKGGAGFMGGPGEAQIELDKRMIDDQIGRIKRDLEQIKRTRHLQRNRRKQVPWPIVALVGYTNAGKSTLFNTLTKADVMAKDMLFATLDPTMRALSLPSGKKVILADTVGFISNLPHQLVEAFKATLEEVMQADILLHVMDMSDINYKENQKNVLEVLLNLGMDEKEQEAKIINVWNKFDLLHVDEKNKINNQSEKLLSDKIIAISSQTKFNLEKLLKFIDQQLSREETYFKIKLPSSQGKLIAWMHENTNVLKQKYTKKGNVKIKGLISSINKSRLTRMLTDSDLYDPNIFQ